MASTDSLEVGIAQGVIPFMLGLTLLLIIIFIVKSVADKPKRRRFTGDDASCDEAGIDLGLLPDGLGNKVLQPGYCNSEADCSSDVPQVCVGKLCTDVPLPKSRRIYTHELYTENYPCGGVCSWEVAAPAAPAAAGTKKNFIVGPTSPVLLACNGTPKRCPLSEFGCVDDFDCGSGRTCLYGVCVATPTAAPCQTSVDCPTDETCVANSNTCAVTPFAQPRPCLTEDNCHADEVCVQGWCLAVPDGTAMSAARECVRNQTRVH